MKKSLTKYTNLLFHSAPKFARHLKRWDVSFLIKCELASVWLPFSLSCEDMVVLGFKLLPSYPEGGV